MPPPRDRLAGACRVPVRRPLPVLAAGLAAAALVGLGALRLQFDSSTEKVFPDAHPAVETYDQFQRVFGTDERLFVALEVTEGDVFAREVLVEARDIAAALDDVPDVREAFAITDLPVLRVGPFGQPSLVAGLPEDLAAATPDQIAAWREEVLATPYVDGVVVSADRRATTAVAELELLPRGPEGAERVAALVRAVEDVLAEHERPGLRLARAGTPIIKNEIVRTVKEDILTFAGPLILVAMLTAFALLRSVRSVLLVLGVLAVASGVTLGAMGHLGIPLGPMTSLVPTLVLVIGVADSMHLLVEQRAQAAALGPEATGAETIGEALQHVVLPCLLTTITTAIGFGSLVFSDIGPIRSFGLWSAVGSIVAFATSMALLPAAAALLGPPRARAARPLRLERLARFATARPWPALLAGAAVTAVLALGLTRIVPNTDFLRFFRADSRIVRDADRIEELFVGVAPCELIVSGPPGTSRSPEALAAVYAFERDLERTDLVDVAFSAADVIAAVEERRTGTPGIPTTRDEVERIEEILLALTGGQLPVERMISEPSAEHPDEELLRVSARARAVGSYRFAQLLDEVEALEAEHLAPAGLSVTPTGTSVVFSQTADAIMSGQVRSFLFAFGVITIVMVLALRSLPLGLVSTVPNFVPIAAILGTMGYAGIELNSFNSMVCSVAIGIAVDDTIHILTGFQRFRRDRPLRAAVEETVAHEGAAVLSTSTVLLGGFSVLLLASFTPTMQFGLLIAIAMAAALLGDLLLLPALLLVLPWRSGVTPEAPAGVETPDPTAPGPEAPSA